MLLCNVDIMTPSGKPLAAIRNVEIQKACDQAFVETPPDEVSGWLQQGLSVNIKVEGNPSPLVLTEKEAAARRKKDEDEIIMFVALDIPY
jgi:hypothetical protein